MSVLSMVTNVWIINVLVTNNKVTNDKVTNIQVTNAQVANDQVTNVRVTNVLVTNVRKTVVQWHEQSNTFSVCELKDNYGITHHFKIISIGTLIIALMNFFSLLLGIIFPCG